MALELYCGDCIEVLGQMPDAVVDLVLVDLPYCVTQNHWDSPVPLSALWDAYLRVAKPDATFVFTAVQPFTSRLVMSNLRMFKYDLVWRKPKGTGHLNAKRQPMKNKEDILVFSRGTPPFNPQMTAGPPYKARGGKRNDDTYGQYTSQRNDNTGKRYPLQVLDFPIVERGKFHSAQKPVELMEYLVCAYSDPDATVLDSCMGSGSTGVACLNKGRGFIGIEIDPQFFNTARQRLGVR